MTWRLYIVPITHVPQGIGGEYAAPKYFFTRLTDGLAGMENIRWAWVRYVWEEHGIIAADVTDAQHALLNTQTDVIVIPALDNTIPNATVRNRVRNILEAGNIPGSWVNTGMTYRQVLRVILGMFKYHGRLVSKVGRVFTSGINLDTTVSQLPAGVISKLQETAEEFGLDYSWVTGATTIRQLIEGMADEFGDREYQLGEIVI